MPVSESCDNLIAKRLQRIVSGGQSGVDRAALDVAMYLDIPHGGWCPLFRRAEDGPIPDHYNLAETKSPGYAERTRKNVIDSDGTLILYAGQISGGTALTVTLARKYHRPLLLVDLEKEACDSGAVRSWIIDKNIQVLNVAGPRESTVPGIAQQAEQFLHGVLAGPS